MKSKAVITTPQTNKQTNQRLLWADVIRIIAIYFVIQVHTTFIYINTHTTATLLNRLDFMGVPLFVLLSGALLLGKSEDYKTFFRKRCFKVLIPWIIWTFLYMTYAIYKQHNQIVADFFNDNESSLFQWSHFFFRYFMTSLYFLPLIFGIYLLTPIFRIIVKHTSNFDNIYILTLWFVLLSFLPWIINGPLFPAWEPTLIYAPIQFSGYFVLGSTVIKMQLFRKIKLPFLFLISILPFFLILIPSNSTYIRNFLGGYLEPGIVMASILFFYFIYAFFEKFDNNINPLVKKIITLISGASFGVYLLNEMFTDYFKNELMLLASQLHSGFLVSIGTFLIITLIILILQKIPVIKYIVP